MAVLLGSPYAESLLDIPIPSAASQGGVSDTPWGLQFPHPSPGAIMSSSLLFRVVPSYSSFQLPAQCPPTHTPQVSLTFVGGSSYTLLANTCAVPGVSVASLLIYQVAGLDFLLTECQPHLWCLVETAHYC